MGMKTIEYLLIKSKNDFCNTVDEFKNWLSVNSRLQIKKDVISIRETDLSYAVLVESVELKQLEEVVFHLTVKCSDEDLPVLEEFDSLLMRINEKTGEQFLINTIWDDVSIYYTGMLYPQIGEVESLLRKLIYCFMIKVSGSSWFDKNTPEKIREGVKETAKKSDRDDINYDQLYYADFDQLQRFMFQKYRLKALDQNMIESLKGIEFEEDAEKAKETIESVIEQYESKSNWDRFFADKIEIEDLANQWHLLYKYRNQVAHNKRMRKDEYDEAISILKKLLPALRSSLDQITGIKVTEEEVEAVQEVAKETVKSKNTINGSSIDFIKTYSSGLMQEEPYFRINSDGLFTINDLSSLDSGTPLTTTDMLGNYNYGKLTGMSTYDSLGKIETPYYPTYISSDPLLMAGKSISGGDNTKDHFESSVEVADTVAKYMESLDIDKKKE